MTFDCAKTENCFQDSQTYEYRLPVTGEAFCAFLSGWSVRCNAKLRRPIFSADKNGVNIKGVLAYNLIRVSFPSSRWEQEKADFEKWLGGINA